MACHELAALRLGLMNVLGIRDEAGRAHEVAEIGVALETPGLIRALAESRDFDSLARIFSDSVVALSERIAKTNANDPDLPYLKSLLVLSKKAEMELFDRIESWKRFYRDLDEMHDYLHEIYPKG